MNAQKTGELIKMLRTEKKMTQLSLAEKLNVSDRAVSKWERGEGCPDITLIGSIAALFSISEKTLLDGALSANETNGGNMNRIHFYVCPDCGNIITAAGKADISCCGRRLEPLKVNPADTMHEILVEKKDDEQFITFTHAMEKPHYLAFIAYAAGDRICLVRLYPEQGGEVHFPLLYGGTFYIYCSQHGLFSQKQ